MTWRWIGLMAGVALSGVAVAGAYTPGKKVAAAYTKAVAAGQGDVRNPRAGDSAAVAAGARLYTTRCVACHGVAGRGDGPAAAGLNPRPADFTDPVRWAYTSDGTKLWLMRTGVPGTGMAPLGLTDDEGWAVLAYVQASFQPPAQGAVAR